MRKVEICGVNTAKLPLLNNEEMRALFVQAQAGDKPARDQLVQQAQVWPRAYRTCAIGRTLICQPGGGRL